MTENEVREILLRTETIRDLIAELTQSELPPALRKIYEALDADLDKFQRATREKIDPAPPEKSG
jgi:hypothetical protein